MKGNGRLGKQAVEVARLGWRKRLQIQSPWERTLYAQGDLHGKLLSGKGCWSYFVTKQGGTGLETKKIVTHIWAIITFFPFLLCWYFDTSLLLIVCALKWYIKSLYRHLFLEDISKNARVTKKWHFLICGKLNSQAPWPQRPKLGVRVAKALSCDCTVWLFPRWTPPEI